MSAESIAVSELVENLTFSLAGFAAGFLAGAAYAIGRFRRWRTRPRI
jgi:hypothetical protein